MITPNEARIVTDKNLKITIPKTTIYESFKGITFSNPKIWL